LETTVGFRQQEQKMESVCEAGGYDFFSSLIDNLGKKNKE